MPAPLTPQKILDCVRFNNLFTSRYFDVEQEIPFEDADKTGIIAVHANGASDHFAHPDQDHPGACVRVRAGSVTVGDTTHDGFVGHDLWTDTIVAYNDAKEVIYRSGKITNRPSMRNLTVA